MNKVCRHCNISFTASGPSACYCSECNKLRKKKTVSKGVQRVPCRVNFIQYRVLIRHQKELYDLGLHKTQEQAEAVVAQFRLENPREQHCQITSNIGYFVQRGPEIKEELGKCNRCSKDLTNATRYEWCLHHRDHDRNNNTDENFELLCKRCHQLEHTVRNKSTGQYIQGSTTIPNGSTLEANASGSGES